MRAMEVVRKRWRPNLVFLKGLVEHAILLIGSLLLAYNSVKEYMRGRGNVHSFPVEYKVLIKSTFPYALVAFLVLYCIYGLGRAREARYPLLREYTVMLAIYTAVVNGLFISNGLMVLAVHEIAVVYFVLLLLLFSVLKRAFSGEADWLLVVLPPIVYGPTKWLLEKAGGILRRGRGLPLVAGYIFLVILSAGMLLAGETRGAESISDIAYLMLVSGVVAEVYDAIRKGGGR